MLKYNNSTHVWYTTQCLSISNVEVRLINVEILIISYQQNQVWLRKPFEVENQTILSLLQFRDLSSLKRGDLI